MEQNTDSTRKLVAFAAAILLCAGVPHFIMERRALAYASESRQVKVLPEALFPPAIGDFQAIDREAVSWHDGTEYVATYSDPHRAQTTQFALFSKLPLHDSTACYFARGMHMREQHAEKLQTADSIAAFQISSFEGASQKPDDSSSMLVASTVCSSAACTDSPISTQNGPRLVMIRASNAAANGDQNFFSLSILFQSKDGAGDAETLGRFRKLMSNVRVGDLRRTLLQSQ